MLEIINEGDGVKISGEVDIATSSQFEDAILSQVRAKRPQVRLDVEDMEYIDSTGIGILMDIKKNHLNAGQEIVLIKPKRSILKLLQLTGADRIFTIEN